MINTHTFRSFGLWLLVLTVLSLHNSCLSGDNQAVLPGATGKVGQLLVVCDEPIWKSPVGDTVKTFFTQDIYGLPQSEPLFDVMQIGSGTFDKLFNSHRNIFIVERLASHSGKGTLEISKDVWAQHQVVMKIKASDNASLIQTFMDNREVLLAYFIKTDRDRLIRAYAGQEEKSITSKMKEKYGLYMSVPRGYKTAVEKDDFFSFRYEEEHTSQVVWVYQQPYTDTSVFAPENLIALRDSIVKKYITSQNAKAYMTTDKKMPPMITRINFNGVFAVEIRGLWYLENDFMGGPFISIATVDTAANRLILAEGFVYAPKFDKRTYLKQTEAIIYSTQFGK